MSQLPLNELVLNLSRNRVREGQDLSDIHVLFQTLANKVKSRSLTL